MACSRVHLATWDRPGLFSRICGAFAAAGLSILSAAIFTRSDGIALDSFYVTDPSRNGPIQPKDQERVARHLRDTLCHRGDLADLIPRCPTRSRFEPQSLEPVPTLIRFDNQSAASRTVLDISTADKIGLLFTIAQTLSDLGIDISVAKISTDRGIAQDTFYIAETGGGRILDPVRQTEIHHRLSAALARA
jgi:[protein-PII] uridylyltransferase